MQAKTMATEPEMKLNVNRPICLGVVGDSGSGKSTLIRGLHDIFGRENVTDICLDDYHRYDREQRKQLGITALNPTANHLLLMAKHLLKARNGEAILKPVYDHSTGTFGTPELILPRKIVIVHGLFTLYSPQFARLFDLGIYLDPSEDLRTNWKIRRDTNKRGYNLAQVLTQIEERRADAATYIHPQRTNADMVISFHQPPKDYHNDEQRLDVEIEFRQALPFPYGNITPYTHITYSYGKQQLLIDGRIDLSNACLLAEVLTGRTDANLQTQLTRVLGNYYEGDIPRHSLTLALTQFLSLNRLTGNLIIAQLMVA